eukprot:2043927-Pyramimonas_sp.AAC.1
MKAIDQNQQRKDHSEDQRANGGEHGIGLGREGDRDCSYYLERDSTCGPAVIGPKSKRTESSSSYLQGSTGPSDM